MSTSDGRFLWGPAGSLESRWVCWDRPLPAPPSTGRVTVATVFSAGESRFLVGPNDVNSHCSGSLGQLIERIRQVQTPSQCPAHSRPGVAIFSFFIHLWGLA